MVAWASFIALMVLVIYSIPEAVRTARGILELRLCHQGVRSTPRERQVLCLFPAQAEPLTHYLAGSPFGEYAR